MCSPRAGMQAQETSLKRAHDHDVSMNEGVTKRARRPRSRSFVVDEPLEHATHNVVFDHETKLKYVEVPGLKELEEAAENARRIAARVIEQKRTDKVMMTLMYIELLEQKIRNKRNQACLCMSHPIMRSELGRVMTPRRRCSSDSNLKRRKVSFSDRPSVIGNADPEVDRECIETTTPNPNERLYIRALRKIPSSNTNSSIVIN